MGKIDSLRAALFIWAGMLVIGLADTVIPMISGQSSLWVFHAIRSGMVLALIGIAAPFFGWRILPQSWVRVSARNGFHAIAMFIYFGALAFVPIGVAVAGVFTAPIFVLILSALFRAERVGWVRWAAVILGFAGALLVVQPEEGGLTLLSLVPLSAGFFYAVGALATRSWCEGEGTIPMLFNYYLVIGSVAVIGLVALTIWPLAPQAGSDGFVSRGWVWPDMRIWALLVFQAVTSVIGVGCLTRGYQIGEATYVAINEYTLILFASFFAWILLDQSLGPVALVGMGLIILAGVAITLRAKE